MLGDSRGMAAALALCWPCCTHLVPSPSCHTPLSAHRPHFLISPHSFFMLHLFPLSILVLTRLSFLGCLIGGVALVARCGTLPPPACWIEPTKPDGPLPLRPRATQPRGGADMPPYRGPNRQMPLMGLLISGPCARRLLDGAGEAWWPPLSSPPGDSPLGWVAMPPYRGSNSLNTRLGLHGAGPITRGLLDRAGGASGPPSLLPRATHLSIWWPCPLTEAPTAHVPLPLVGCIGAWSSICPLPSWGCTPDHCCCCLGHVSTIGPEQLAALGGGHCRRAKCAGGVFGCNHWNPRPLQWLAQPGPVHPKGLLPWADCTGSSGQQSLCPRLPARPGTPSLAPDRQCPFVS